MNLFEMKKRQQEAIAKADALVKAAEDGKRDITETESKDIDAALLEAQTLSPQIQQIEKLNTLKLQFPTGRIVPGTPGARANRRGPLVFTAEYFDAFVAWTASRGKHVDASLTEGMDQEGGYKFPAISATTLVEGTNSAGGYAVPSQVAGEIVPLAPPQMGISKLASVVPTIMDTRYPRKASHGTAATKAEGPGGTFGGTDPVLEQFTLSAFMIGHIEDASWELLQDVAQFQAFMNDDILLSIAILKESKFVSGSGTGEPQGLIGNVGAGVTCGTHAYADILDSTFDILGILNAVYHLNAAFVMQRATSVGLRKAQKQANLFEPIFTRVAGQDYLHGYPVEYSDSLPANGVAATPILFGDFKRGYLIGERGGSGVSVKILDQTKAASGLVQVLGYQRVDGRVRRSEAIQRLFVT